MYVRICFTDASVTFERSFYSGSEGDGVLTITLVSSLAAEFSFAINVIPIRLSANSKKPYLCISYGTYIFCIFTQGSNFLPNSLKVIFQPKHINASFNISISDDNILEYSEVFNLTLSIPHEVAMMGIILGKRMTTSVTIYDNDGMHEFKLWIYLSIHMQIANFIL